jgi:hypothetical protein
MLTLIFWHRGGSYVDTDILAPRRVLCWHWYFGTEEGLMLTLIFWHRGRSYVDIDILAPRRVLCWHWYFGTEKGLMLTLIFWHRGGSYVDTDILAPRRVLCWHWYYEGQCWWQKDSNNKRKKCVSFNNALNCWVYTAWITYGYGIMTRYSGDTWRKPCHSETSHMKWWTLPCRAAEDVSFYLHVTLKMETECCSEKSMSRYENIINVEVCWYDVGGLPEGCLGGGANFLLCLPLRAPILNLIKFN